MNPYLDHSVARYPVRGFSRDLACYPARLSARCSVAGSEEPASDGYSTLRPFPDPICLRIAEPGDTTDGGRAAANGRDHDASYKLVFSFREVVRDLIHGFIGDPWLRSLDWNSLEPVPGSYVSDRLRYGINDVVWRIEVAGQEQPLYLLIEFQSRIDTDMAARMLAYVGMFYRDASRRRDRRRGSRRATKYPAVLPIVLYNGSRPWRANTEIAAMISPLPQSMASHQPRLNYCLIDRTRYTDSQLAAMRNLVAVLMRFERAQNIEAMLEPLRLARELTAHNAALDQAMTAWFAALTPNALHLTEVHNLKELEMEMSARFDRWAQQYTKKGIEKGVHIGKAESLQKLLRHRFGPLSSHVIAKLDAASTAQLEAWQDRALEAQCLEDVFRP
ncbi:Rpn family recombination-promoting nuclease/putative transposase [Cupriavidus gilardii]|uniref:Rpn family recombination-promoting nuclease/putative transposase n=1 Tax=Cupriavidus gilardii TaxID=82541 RepID=UPI001ABE9BD8|nr:Rpn family recombination-promoting nuclease/putative transposase [Cupriavidus gilardii]MBO4123159.1 Rpn family recombination-promoting nuclease/putative transposase [Cupriavidus gilardii]